jgi:hypothetical protein
LFTGAVRPKSFICHKAKKAYNRNMLAHARRCQLRGSGDIDAEDNTRAQCWRTLHTLVGRASCPVLAVGRLQGRQWKREVDGQCTFVPRTKLQKARVAKLTRRLQALDARIRDVKAGFAKKGGEIKREMDLLLPPEAAVTQDLVNKYEVLREKSVCFLEFATQALSQAESVEEGTASRL